jgi:hypothetical protein
MRLYQLSWYSLIPRKQQGWITFQSSEEERKILEEYCQQSQRTKTERKEAYALIKSSNIVIAME